MVVLSIFHFPPNLFFCSLDWKLCGNNPLSLVFFLSIFDPCVAFITPVNAVLSLAEGPAPCPKLLPTVSRPHENALTTYNPGYQ